MRQALGTVTLQDALILRNELGGKEGNFVAICGDAAVQIQYLTDRGGGECQLVNPGDKVILPLEDKNQITISSPTDTYPLTLQYAIDREGIGYDAPHQANSDLASQIASDLGSAQAFEPAKVYESTEFILSADTAQDSQESYSVIDSVQVAVTSAPTAAGKLYISDNAGTTFATVTLIAGLLNFFIQYPRPLVLGKAGLLVIESTVAVTVSVSVTGN